MSPAGRPSVSFDRIADDYDRTRGGEERGERYAAVLEPLFDRSHPVLEVGVGTGLVAAGLQRKGFRLLGLDLSHAMARRAHDRLGPSVTVGDARRMPFRDACVAQAYSVWVLHVVGDVPAVLREVARVLRPGGRYAVAPGAQLVAQDEIARRLQDLERALDPERRRDDGVSRLAELGPAAGLRVADLVPYHHRFPEAPEAVAEKLESRALSFLWDVDDERWSRHVVPVIEWLRALPDPERPIVRSVNDQLVVLERD